VVADGDYVGSTLYQGLGAGGGPTASSVVSDLVALARGDHGPSFGVAAVDLGPAAPVPMERHVGAYYICLTVRDEPGVIAEITATFRDERISLESMLQRSRAPGEPVPVVLVTHETAEASMNRALEQIGTFETMLSPPRMIRIEAF
jgi:homoserine dehydrogenase